ncbi:MAG: hypothetical protein KBC41_00860 [Candidatus Pacebacteria bacterium]|nr:hypothetical protein [Candidatus Paceibacterota bacterium]MBP9866613.1 hypothetical protein [Candidatus Paceibacterota bacterium]
MKHLVTSLTLIMHRKDSRWVIIIATLVCMLLLLLLQNGKAANEILNLEILSFGKRISLATRTLFDIQNTFTAGALILAVLGSFLGGINLSLAYTYMRLRGEVLLHSGLYSGIGLLFAFFGIGCAACGTALLSIILSFFGFSAMLDVLPYQGQEIGYIGLLLLCIATYTLAHKVAVPNVC